MNEHILMVCEYYYPFDRGGSEWSTYYLAQGLKKKGITVSIVTPNYGAASEELCEGILVHRFPFLRKLASKNDQITPYFFTNTIWWAVTLHYLYRFVKKNHITHVHVQGKYFLPAAIIVGKLLHVPVITTVRDYIVLCPYAYCLHESDNACTSLVSFYQKDLKKYFEIHKITSLWQKLFLTITGIRGKFSSWILQFFIKRSTCIVAISHHVMGVYQKNGIAVDRVIYNSINVTKQKKANKPHYILYIGRLTYGKGVNLLAAAYARSLKINPLIPKLLLVGNGPLDIIFHSKFNKKIMHLKHVSHNKIPNLIKKAFFVVVPSVWPEPFGRVALESLAQTVPVLATNRGGLPEIVLSNKYGLVVNADIESITKGLIKMCQKSNKFHEIIQSHYSEIIKKFVNDPVNNYVRIYKNL